MSATLQRLVGVYAADHTLRGEVTSFVGARLGRAHCALCDITHGRISEKSAWRICRATLAVPFDTFHRDDQPVDVRVALDGAAPAVVAVTDGGVVLLLDRTALDRCAGEPDALVAAIDAAVEHARLVWPAGSGPVP